MTKYTPLRVQNELQSKIHSFHDRAKAAKESYYAARKEVLNNDRLSPGAQHEDVAKLTEKVANDLTSILAEQQRYVDGLKSDLEKELRGSLPQDANSIMLRRDAADRARKITDEREALAVLQDAVSTGDESMAHAIGTKARSHGWINAAEVWQQAHPDTSGIAEALAYVEDATSDVGYRVGNSMAYSQPTE